MPQPGLLSNEFNFVSVEPERLARLQDFLNQRDGLEDNDPLSTLIALEERGIAENVPTNALGRWINLQLRD